MAGVDGREGATGSAGPLAALWSRIVNEGMGRSLRHRDYRLFCITHWFSAAGMWVQKVGVGWLTWELTHSGTWLGVVAAVEALPFFVLTPIAGAVADRVDRLGLFRNLQKINLLMSSVLTALTLGGLINIYLLVGIIGIAGIVNALAIPARMTIAPGMVPREDVPAAIGLNSISFQLSAFVGPAASGLIISLWGVGYAFGFNALSYLVFVTSLYFVSMPYDSHKADRRSGVFSQTWEGLRYLGRHPSIGPLLLLVLAASMLTRPFMDLLPGFADVIFGRGADGLATLVAAGGVGGMAAGLWLAQFARTDGMTRIVFSAVVAVCVVLILFASTGAFWLAVGCVAMASAAATLISAGSQMLIQNAVDNAMRGRVMSVYGLTWRGAPALGALVMGALSTEFGLQAPVAGGAALCLAFWALTLPRRRALAAGLEDLPAAVAPPENLAPQLAKDGGHR